MQTKTCRDCGIEKSLDEFYVHAQMADGHLNKCKACVRERIRLFRFNNPDHISEIDKARNDRRKADPEFRAKRRVYLSNYRTSERMRAHAIAESLPRPSQCSSCHIRPAEHAHHPDYSKPVEVIWLCVRCHQRLHHSGGAEARA